MVGLNSLRAAGRKPHWVLSVAVCSLPSERGVGEPGGAGLPWRAALCDSGLEAVDGAMERSLDSLGAALWPEVGRVCVTEVQLLGASHQLQESSDC